MGSSAGAGYAVDFPPWVGTMKAWPPWKRSGNGSLPRPIRRLSLPDGDSIWRRRFGPTFARSFGEDGSPRRRSKRFWGTDRTACDPGYFRHHCHSARGTGRGGPAPFSPFGSPKPAIEGAAPRLPRFRLGNGRLVTDSLCEKSGLAFRGPGSLATPGPLPASRPSGWCDLQRNNFLERFADRSHRNWHPLEGDVGKHPVKQSLQLTDARPGLIGDELTHV
jgi:hypothetical protein